MSGILGKDIMSLVLLNLDILDASTVGLTCRTLLRLFESEIHFMHRLRIEFGRSSVRARFGKGSKKRKTPASAAGSRKLYEMLHLARRATFRTLITFSKVRGDNWDLKLLLDRVESDEFRAFQTSSDRWGYHSISTPPKNARCSFPVGFVSSELNAIVFRNGDQLKQISLVSLCNRLKSRQSRARVAVESVRSIASARFTDLQWSILIQHSIICKCGSILWSADDACCTN